MSGKQEPSSFSLAAPALPRLLLHRFMSGHVGGGGALKHDARIVMDEAQHRLRKISQFVAYVYTKVPIPDIKYVQKAHICHNMLRCTIIARFFHIV